jgi:hypothetical protein
MSLKEPSQDFSTPPSRANRPRKQPVSERRIQANRRNALRSTGPKTARGKRAVAGNAIKHGFLAREVVITAGEGEESLKEFHDLVEKLCEHYGPFGVVEESLVQMIATCWWRKARVIRAENGEIRRRLDTVAVDRERRNSDKGNFDLASMEMDLGLYHAENPADRGVSTRERWSAMQRAQSNMRGHHPSLAYLRVLLTMAKSEIASDGHLSETIREKIVFAYCLSDPLFADTCLYAGPPEAKVDGQPPDIFEDKQADKKHPYVVESIDIQLERLSAFERYATKREGLVGDAEARSFSLPPTDATDKLLRYEAHLDRQLYRAMDQLERLQRQRRGETVPPPLNINLGRER